MLASHTNQNPILADIQLAQQRHISKELMKQIRSIPHIFTSL